MSLAVAALVAIPASAPAQAGQGIPGTGVDALPGIGEVPLSVQPAPGVVGRVGLGYGWTESVLGMQDDHHRFQLDVAGSLTPLAWLSASARVLGRYDAHTAAGSSDYGIITETHLGARATHRLTDHLSTGTQLELWLPAGDDAGSAVSAVSGELQWLLTYAWSGSPLTVGLALGLRLERSRFAGGRPDLYSAADRLALGRSDRGWALPQGLAVSYRLGPVEWIAGWAFRMYLPQADESPMWIRAGARYRLERVQFELLLGVSPSQRRSNTDGSWAIPIEPRLSGGVAATYAWSLGATGTKLSRTHKPTRVRQPKRKPSPEPIPAAMLKGHVHDVNGGALSAATATLRQGPARTETTTDDQGRFAFVNVPAGPYSLELRAAGFVPVEKTIVLEPGDTLEQDFSLKRELPAGQIRGTVAGFDGRPVVASVAILELEIVQQTREDGSFEFDVPPGRYTIEVTAPGFRRQARAAPVELRGVAILVVELESEK